MFSTIKYKKVAKALAAAGIVFAASSYATDKEALHVIKVKQINDDVKVMVSEGHNSDVRVIKLDKADLNSEVLVEKLADLPDEARQKIEEVLEQIDLNDNKVTVFADKVVQKLGKDGEVNKVVFVQHDSEDFTLHLPPEPPLPPGAPKPVKPAKAPKIFKFSFGTDGEGDHEFKLITSLLKETKLTPEQIDELQTLLNEKY
ncbi:hypothetical protein C1E24_06965 [Pseudoalteromonas phenolica]|uniref:Uncharacterized protein n=1 Tax=Pseudoalteromonas phenolica TaxID=161398 RepID=A0A5R9Q5E2_9GAMM|nr:hypothetical protein [Pseudoalteromonas phenolica]TLX47726.1 hypothetical protein C1E24_06965 [Pseudoalteromonas phenolica]